jgi:hypothetical protein
MSPCSVKSSFAFVATNMGFLLIYKPASVRALSAAMSFRQFVQTRRLQLQCISLDQPARKRISHLSRSTDESLQQAISLCSKMSSAVTHSRYKDDCSVRTVLHSSISLLNYIPISAQLGEMGSGWHEQRKQSRRPLTAWTQIGILHTQTRELNKYMEPTTCLDH